MTSLFFLASFITSSPSARMLSADAKEALRQFDALTGDSLNRTGAQDGAGSSDKQEKPKKKKGFMDKIKESLDDI